MGVLGIKLVKCTFVWGVLGYWMLMMTGVGIQAAIRHQQSHHHLKLSSFSSDSVSALTSPSSSSSSLSSQSSSSSLPSIDIKGSTEELFGDDADVEGSANVEKAQDVKSSRAHHGFYKRYMGAESEAKDQTSQQSTQEVEPPRSRMPYGLTKGLFDIRKANEHYLKVHTQARCKYPKARVVKVKDYYPDPTKGYLPSCTILHKCGDDIGCCDSDSMQCVARKQDIIELYFYKLHLSNAGGGIGISGSNTVEKLTFLNDTECECQVVDDRPRFHVRKTACLQCPSGFSLREPQHGVCSCDCFDKQKSCLKMKRGREPLSESDRRCVDTRRCHQPECEYGLYDSTLGRCPRKHERRSTNYSGHHFWRYDERD